MWIAPNISFHTSPKLDMLKSGDSIPPLNFSFLKRKHYLTLNGNALLSLLAEFLLDLLKDSDSPQLILSTFLSSNSEIQREVECW